MELINLFLKEFEMKNINNSLLKEYSIKRDRINYIAKKLGFKEKRDGRGIRYTGINDKIDYCKKYCKNGSKEELGKALENFSELRRQILGSYMRLAINIARKYAQRNSDVEDYTQEGLKGLLYATERFNVKKGFKFSTYATHWVRQHIERYMFKNFDDIKIPYHIRRDISRLRKNDAKLVDNELTVSEIERKLKISEHEARNVMLALNVRNTMSLDQEINDGETTLKDMIGTTEGVRDNLWIDYALPYLDKREKEIIKSRYMLNKPLTLDTVGKKLNLTRERVRQIETKALRKIGDYYNKIKNN